MPVTVLASLARRPVVPKLGFCFSFSGTASGSVVWPKESACEGRAWRDCRVAGERDRGRGRGERDLLCDLCLRFALDE